MVHSTQTVHLSCVKISTISKRTETSFHLSLVTFEYHQVHPKQFLTLWYVWCKPCTYLISRLALSPNGPKWASIWATSPSTIGCLQNDFWANGMVQTVYLTPTLTPSPNGPMRDSIVPMSHRSSIGCVQMISKSNCTLAQTMHLSCLKISTISKQTETSLHLSLVTKEYHRVCPNQFLSLWYVWCKPCTYLTLTLTLSPSEPIRGSTWPISPRYVWHKPCTYLVSRLALSLNAPNWPSTRASSRRRTIECIQNDFWAYGMFGANRAPILPKD
jgi:hypothetical protein